MSQVSLPHTIDPGDPVNAAPLQENFEELRDTINGDLEGGSSGNLKANGVTARELDDKILLADNAGLQAGVVEATGGKVTTAGSGLSLNYAAGTMWVPDNSGVLTSNAALLPVSLSASSIAVGTANGSNPRIDQIVLRVTGYGTGVVEVLAGTATAGADLDDRLGAAALGSDRIRLADVLVPTAFAGPFVNNTHIRDRRPWARGAHGTSSDTTSGALLVSSTTYAFPGISPSAVRLELSGNYPVRATAWAHYTSSTAAVHSTFVGLMMNGSTTAVRETSFTQPAASTSMGYHPTWLILPSEFAGGVGGSNTFAVSARVGSSNSTFARDPANPFGFSVQEVIPAHTSQNDGA